MTQAIKEAKSTQTTASTYASERTSLKEAFTRIEELGNTLVSNVEGRLLWMELLKGLDVAMPTDTVPRSSEKIPRRI